MKEKEYLVSNYNCLDFFYDNHKLIILLKTEGYA